jgi:hypothetical protein
MINEPMIIVPSRGVPEDILSGSVLAHIAAAYFSVDLSFQHFGMMPGLIKTKSPPFLVSTELSYIGPSGQWFRKDWCRSGRQNRAGQFMLG